MARFFKSLWSVVSNATQAWQLWTWIAPTGVISAMTAYLAKLAEVDDYQIVLFALGAFCLASLGWAGIFVALLRQKEWLDRTRIEGKLDYIQPSFGVQVHWDDDGKPKFIDKINVGLQLRNMAFETIQYKLNTFHAVVEGRTPNTDRFVGRIWNIVSQSLAVSHPDEINIGELGKLDIKGHVEFELVYGSKNSLNYVIKKNQEFDIVVHRDNSVKPNPSIGVAVRDRG